MRKESFFSPFRLGARFPDSQQSTGLLVSLLICVYLIVTSTVNAFPSIPVWDTKRSAEFVLFFVVFLIALASAPLRNAFISQLSRIPLWVAMSTVLFLVLGIASSLMNHDSLRGLVYSLVDVVILALLFVLTIVTAACRSISGQRFDRVVILFLTLLGLAVGAQEIAGYLALWFLGSTFSFDTALIYFSFPRMYNHLQTLTVPLLPILPLLFTNHRLASAGCVITLGLHWNILLLTGARGSIVSLLAAFALVFILSPKTRKLTLKWHSAGLALGLVIYAAMFVGTEFGHGRQIMQESEANRPITTSSELNILEAGSRREPNEFVELSVGRPMFHTTGRTRLWRSAIDNAQDKPFLGIGPMNFACKGPEGRVGSPHNFVFQVLSEWGVPAAIVILMLGFGVLLRLFSGLRAEVEQAETISMIRVCIITAILAALVHLMVSSLLIAPASQVAIALVGGWLLGATPVQASRKISGAVVAVLPMAIFCSLLLLPFAYHELNSMPSYREQLPAIEQGRPRLWQLGKACSTLVK